MAKINPGHIGPLLVNVISNRVKFNLASIIILVSFEHYSDAKIIIEFDENGWTRRGRAVLKTENLNASKRLVVNQIHSYCISQNVLLL